MSKDERGVVFVKGLSLRLTTNEEDTFCGKDKTSKRLANFSLFLAKGGHYSKKFNCDNLASNNRIIAIFLVFNN